ncbi:DUF2793 domain-containing protein [Novosphingobium gossypii]|uniref:DUF2793 domain-containing protein n=1 Tax=Novosphingobium gossypii TaxID=1604774 RepID=UPI003D19F5E9
MPDPIEFASASPRFALPLLHAGQAQKEVFVNEATMLTDLLLHCTVLGETATPAQNAQENDTWIVAPGATGEWAGHDAHIAVQRSGAWVFIPPRDGMRVFNRASGAGMLFFGYWRKGSIPVEPLGGSSVDGEARTAINDLVSALQALGILPME